MRRVRILTGIFFCLACATLAGAQEKNLLSLASDLGAVLEWNPLRDNGVLDVGQDRIALGVGTDSVLINYRLKITIDPPVRRAGAVWLTMAAVTAISNGVQKDRLRHAGELMRVSTILIDPGHGGTDPGTLGSFMVKNKKVVLKEKDVNLAVGLKLRDMLAAAYPDKKIVMTRSTDTTVGLEERTDMANALLKQTTDTVLFLSIHTNASPFKTSASGYEVWCLPSTYERTDLVDESMVAKGDEDILPILSAMKGDEIYLESTMLANQILNGLGQSVGAKSVSRGVKFNDWYVVRNSRVPAVLTEVGFVTNPEEAARLADDAYLKDVAKGIYTGVDAFLAQFERNGSSGVR
jgi:N-acetylmuramoyl-L-alanine amidase